MAEASDGDKRTRASKRPQEKTNKHDLFAVTNRKPSVSYGELHQVLVERLAPPSVLINESYDMMHISESAGRFLRFTGGEPSHNLLKAVHPDLRLDLRAALFAASQEGHETETRRLSVKVDGETQHLKVLVRPVTHEDLPRDYLLVIFDTFVNITERKRAEEVSQEAEEHLRLLMESIQDYAIFTLDAQGRIISWNPGAEKIIGYSEAEAIGQHGEIIFTPEDRERGVPEEEMRTAIEKGRAMDDRWHLRKDGSRFYASGVMAPLRVGGEIRGYVKVARDITQQKQAETARDEMTAQVEDERARLEIHVDDRTRELVLEIAERRSAEERVKELLRRVVRAQELERQRISRDLHDQLGQQLTALRLNLETIKDRSGDNAIAEQVAQAQAVAENLDSEVDFLAWELRPAALDETGLVAALENFVQEWAKHFNIKADYHTARLTNIRFTPEAETSLYRIAQEALNNVYKHAGATRVDVILERRDQNAVLIVEDDGRGFDTEADMDEGRGMGLLNMRERAALIGGEFDIESTPGEGTTIFIRIPINREKNGGGVGSEE